MKKMEVEMNGKMDADAVLRAIATIAATTLDNVHGAQHELNDLMLVRIKLIRDLAVQAGGGR